MIKILVKRDSYTIVQKDDGFFFLDADVKRACEITQDHAMWFLEVHNVKHS